MMVICRTPPEGVKPEMVMQVTEGMTANLAILGRGPASCPLVQMVLCTAGTQQTGASREDHPPRSVHGDRNGRFQARGAHAHPQKDNPTLPPWGPRWASTYAPLQNRRCLFEPPHGTLAFPSVPGQQHRLATVSEIKGFFVHSLETQGLHGDTLKCPQVPLKPASRHNTPAHWRAGRGSEAGLSRTECQGMSSWACVSAPETCRGLQRSHVQASRYHVRPSNRSEGGCCTDFPESSAQTPDSCRHTRFTERTQRRREGNGCPGTLSTAAPQSPGRQQPICPLEERKHV